MSELSEHPQLKREATRGGKAVPRTRQLEILVLELVRLVEMNLSEDGIVSDQWQLVHDLVKSMGHERDADTGDKFDGTV